MRAVKSDPTNVCSTCDVTCVGPTLKGYGGKDTLPLVMKIPDNEKHLTKRAMLGSSKTLASGGGT